MGVIINTEITKVYEGPSGSGKYGPWQIYNFYVKDHEEKFSVFGKDDLVPVPGLKLKLLKYEIKHSEKDGKNYTNYNIKEIILEEGQASQPTQKQPQGTQKSPQKQKVDWDAIAFKKCKYGFLQQAFVPFYNKDIIFNGDIDYLEQEAERFATMCMRILAKTTKVPEKPQEQESKVQPSTKAEDPYQGDTPPIDSYQNDSIPF